jgi:dienelactone hydrolase
MIGTRVSYLDEQQRLEGYLAAPNSARDLPGVLVVPSWLNVNESICKRADRLAELGYVAFVVDLFGAAVRPGPPQSPTTVVGPFLEDRLRFRRRLSAGLRAFQKRPECNADRIAAVGYCIGGCGVLELARAGAAFRGVVSLHGILSAPIPARRNTVVSKILVLHGDADPVVSADSVIDFIKEMRLAQANWQVNVYSDAKHSFTGEGVAGGRTPEAGLHPQTETRSWHTTVEFLREVFELSESLTQAE